MSRTITVGIVEAVSGVPHFSAATIAEAGRRLGAEPDAVAELVGELMRAYVAAETGIPDPLTRLIAQRGDPTAPVRRFDAEGREVA